MIETAIAMYVAGIVTGVMGMVGLIWWTERDKFRYPTVKDLDEYSTAMKKSLHVAIGNNEDNQKGQE